MFKKCKDSVCSTNSVGIGPTSKVPITVVRHPKSIPCGKSRGGSGVQEGTNSMLRNGGMLPFILPQQSEISTQQAVKKRHTNARRSVSTPHSTDVKPTSSVLKARSVPQSCTLPRDKTKSLRQGAAKQAKCKGRLSEHEENVDKIDERLKHISINKDNYLDFVSQFNERCCMDPYDPSEFSGKHEEKRKASAAISTTRCRTTPDTSNLNYDENTKIQILRSIREELQAWRRSKLADQ